VSLEIVVMTRDRPDELKRCLMSISKLDFGLQPKIIISNNSEMGLDDSSFPECQVLNRGGVFTTQGHMQKIIEEVRAEWLLITHDDDEILPYLAHLFQLYKADTKVEVITGKSRIFDSDGHVVMSSDYEKRLSKLGLNSVNPILNEDFSQSIYKFGSMFPASAILVRRSKLETIARIPEKIGLAYDLSYSMRVAHDSLVVFGGTNPVMNYHLHKGNSVFSEVAMRGLHVDLVIARLDAIQNNLIKNSIMNSMILTRFVFKAMLVCYVTKGATNLSFLVKEVRSTDSKGIFVKAITSNFTLTLFKVLPRNVLLSIFAAKIGKTFE
jgi:hypothetical protein